MLVNAPVISSWRVINRKEIHVTWESGLLGFMRETFPPFLLRQTSDQRCKVARVKPQGKRKSALGAVSLSLESFSPHHTLVDGLTLPIT